MTKLISNSAQVEISNKVQDVLRNLMISDWQSEPHQQHQNPAERRYQVVKWLTNNLLDRSGAPRSLWFLAMSHVCLLLNHTANESIGYAIPLSLLTGVTQDISALLHYDWYQPVYYREEEPHFPSKPVEKYGHFVGIAENVGHALTFKVLSEDTQKILHRSVIQSATNPATANKRAINSPDIVPQPHVHSCFDINDEANTDNEILGHSSMPIIHPEELIGRSFPIPQEDGELLQATIVEAISNHERLVEEHLANIQFRCSVNNDKYEEIMSYNQIMDYLSKDDGDPVVWRFNKILAHQGPLDSNHKDYKGSTFNISIEWENGEVSEEPLTIIAADDPVTCAIYARDNNLLDTPGWKRFKTIAKRQKNFFRAANQAKLRSFSQAPKFKYGQEIPANYSKAMDLDDRNMLNKWADATQLELDLMDSYNVFKDQGPDAKVPNGYKVIRVHLIYDVKHDGRHRA